MRTFEKGYRLGKKKFNSDPEKWKEIFSRKS